MLPDIDGYDVCHKIREFVNVPILFLSALYDEIERIKCFAVGGDDYLAKPFSPNEFVYRIKSNLSRLSVRNIWEDKEIIEVGDLEIRPRESVVKKKGIEIGLYPIEFNLLIFFVENMNVILSHDQLVEKVLGKNSIEGDKNTLRVHIKYGFICS